MSKALDAIVARLRRKRNEVSEFLVVERERDQAFLALMPEVATTGQRPAELQRGSRDTTFHITLFRDVRRGRGSAEIRLRGGEEAAVEPMAMDRLIDAAILQAGRSIGPAWSLPAPAAPARVPIADPALMEAESEEAARAMLQQVTQWLAGTLPATEPAGAVRICEARVTVAKTRTTMRTNHGFSYTYPATDIEVSATLAASQGQPAERGALTPPGSAAVEHVALVGRRLADLSITSALSRAAGRLADRGRAGRLQPGQYDLVLAESALVPQPAMSASHSMHAGYAAEAEGRLGGSLGIDRSERFAHYGWLSPIVALADPWIERQGLLRYPRGRPIWGAPVSGRPGISFDTLTIYSDGSIPYAVMSQPVGALGEPVRRFALLKRNTLTGQSLSLREAALRRRTPNGGMRNLVITPGTWDAQSLLAPSHGPTIEAVSLAWLTVDVHTGDFAAELGLGYLREAGKTAEPVAGGVVRGNIFDLLGSMRLSADRMVTGWYHGPAMIRFESVTVV